MAVDKLVDSTQLNADLTSVANAIRAKSGTSAQLAFPGDFVSAIGDIQTGGGALEPFDTYEFNVPNDINYQDATGTATRDLATLDWHQASLDKFAEYTSVTTADHPFSVAGCARVLFVITPKNNNQVVADSTYVKFIRRDVIQYMKNTNGAVTRNPPYARIGWKINTDGSYAYTGDFNAGDNRQGFNPITNLANKLVINIQLSQNGAPMVAAGDYVVKLYDLSGTVM